MKNQTNQPAASNSDSPPTTLEAWKKAVSEDHPLATIIDHLDDKDGPWSEALIAGDSVGDYDHTTLEGTVDDPLDASDKFEAILNKRGDHHFEGDFGLGKLETICEEVLGYQGHNFRHGDPLSHFLSDNPGAQQAIIDWILENAKCYEEAIDSAYEEEFSPEEEEDQE